MLTGTTPGIATDAGRSDHVQRCGPPSNPWNDRLFITGADPCVAVIEIPERIIVTGLFRHAFNFRGLAITAASNCPASEHVWVAGQIRNCSAQIFEVVTADYYSYPIHDRQGTVDRRLAFAEDEPELLCVEGHDAWADAADSADQEPNPVVWMATTAEGHDPVD